MGNINKLILCSLFAITAASLSVVGQNFFIRVFDESNLQAVPDVRVTLESPDSRITMFTGARGDASSFVPTGTYTLILEKRGYDTKKVDRGITIRANETANIEYHISSIAPPVRRDDAAKPATREAERPETTKTIDRTETRTEPHERVARTEKEKKELSFERDNRRFYLDVGYQIGNIQTINVGGAFVYQNICLNVTYARGNQEYRSEFFIMPRRYNISFNNLLLGLGYDYAIPFRINDLGFFVNPFLFFGYEFTGNDRLINDNDIKSLVNYMIKPQFITGVSYQRFDFYVSANYTHWLSPGMTDQRLGMKNYFTGKDIVWHEDLFSEREGAGFSIGLKINF